MLLCEEQRDSPGTDHSLHPDCYQFLELRDASASLDKKTCTHKVSIFFPGILLEQMS